MNEVYKRIGTLVPVGSPEMIREGFRRVHEFGMGCCQLMARPGMTTSEIAGAVTAASKEFDVYISAVWAGWSGPAEWNFYEGPLTLGLMPHEYREKRVEEVLDECRFARDIGVTDVITHVGFIPENPNDPEFESIVLTLRHICKTIGEFGQYFLFETGQETPTTLLRTIEEVGTGNLGVNLDTANLILYGRGNPVDALDVIGKYVRNTHMKDGFYPVSGRSLGEEVPLGEGKVNVREFIKKSEGIGYKGCYCIEREISGERQNLDIIAARDLIAETLRGC